jgi:hypothetical protein
LAAERQHITGPLTLGKLVMTALVPIWFIALLSMFRRRSWAGGAIVIGVGTLLKILWSFSVADDSAWSIVPPVAWDNSVRRGPPVSHWRFTTTASLVAAIPGSG